MNFFVIGLEYAESGCLEPLEAKLLDNWPGNIIIGPYEHSDPALAYTPYDNTPLHQERRVEYLF